MELQPSHRDVQVIHGSYHLDRSVFWWEGLKKIDMQVHWLSKEVESQTGVTISHDTIQHTLQRNGMHGCRPRKKPLLKPRHKKALLEFARAHTDKDEDYWDSILCSDETKIIVFGTDGFKTVWRRKGEEYKEKCIFLQWNMVVAVSCMSPDLNPIEHLWWILKRQVEHHSPSSIQSLKEVILEEWKKIDLAKCRQLVHSMPRRLGAVIKNHGGYTVLDLVVFVVGCTHFCITLIWVKLKNV